MTTLDQARELCFQRWKANTSLASTRYCFEDQAFTPPAVGQWARVSVLNTVSQPLTMGAPGNRKVTRRAFLFAKIYDEADKRGSKTLDDLAHASRAIFEMTHFSGLRFFAAEVREAPTDGKWIVRVLSAPFDYQEIK